MRLTLTWINGARPGMHKEIAFIPCSSRQAFISQSKGEGTRYETSDQTSA